MCSHRPSPVRIPKYLMGYILFPFILCNHSSDATAADLLPAYEQVAGLADRICGTVIPAGSDATLKTAIDANASVKGALKRFADIHGDVNVSSGGSLYMGLQRQDVPLEMDDTRKCKLQVLDLLKCSLISQVDAQRCIRDSAAPSSTVVSPAPPTPTPIPTPAPTSTYLSASEVSANWRSSPEVLNPPPIGNCTCLSREIVPASATPQFSPHQPYTAGVVAKMKNSCGVNLFIYQMLDSNVQSMQAPLNVPAVGRLYSFENLGAGQTLVTSLAGGVAGVVLVGNCPVPQFMPPPPSNKCQTPLGQCQAPLYGPIGSPCGCQGPPPANGTIVP